MRHLPRPDLWRDAFLAVGLAVGIAQAFGLTLAVDAVIYWRADLDALYPLRYVSGDPVFVYAPPMAQIIALLQPLGFGLFTAGLAVALFGALWYCAGRWSWVFLGLGAVGALVPEAPAELKQVLGYATLGNVQLLLAAAIVASVRRPGLWAGLWAAPLLTKATMGVGLLWFVFRREWRAAVIALAATAAIAGVSFALAPELWLEFLGFTLRNRDLASALPTVPVPLPVRLAMSAALLAWAAPRGHRWALPVAAGWAMPILYVGAYLAVWIGAIRLGKKWAEPVGLAPLAVAPREHVADPNVRPVAQPVVAHAG